MANLGDNRAALRLPQYLRPSCSELRPCPLRPEKLIYEGEGPHALSWLAYRGDTVRLRRTHG